MAAYRRVYDSHHLHADCQEPGSSPEPYARQSIMGYHYLFTAHDVHVARCLHSTAGRTIGWMNHANESRQAAPERASQEA